MHVLQSRVLLRPADFDRSVAFYETGLGLVRYREWGQAPERGVVYFLGGGFLELTEGDPEEDPGRATVDADPEATPLVRLWLQVADVAAVRRELAERGVDVADEPKLKSWGLIEMSVEDPDGVRLVFIETPLTHPLRRRE